MFNKGFNLGDSDDVNLDVKGISRMRLDLAQLNDTPATEPAAGAARVLCDG